MVPRSCSSLLQTSSGSDLDAQQIVLSTRLTQLGITSRIFDSVDKSVDAIRLVSATRGGHEALPLNNL